LKIVTLATVLCLLAGVGWVLRKRFPDHTITARELLREAVAECQRAGGPGEEMGREIFEQQALQGYYDDAAATGHLLLRPDDVGWSLVELARIRAENGDLQGAKALMKRAAGSDIGRQIVKAVALAQLSKGDLQGGLEIAAAGVDREEILLAFARRQIANSDFAAALETSARMKSPGQVFFELGNALRERSEQKRVRELASGMSDRKLAADFVNQVRPALWNPVPELAIQATPCQIAADYGREGKFAEANALIEQNKCTDVSVVAIRQYAVDPEGAERLLRGRSNADDLLIGLDQLAVAAAKKGNINEALRFFGDLQNLQDRTARSSVLPYDRVTEAIPGIARYWTVKDGPKVVLKWARLRPTGEQRTWALIGIAQALGHASPASEA
jgi:tetratricopeptide (TPR) repeat protein